MLYLSWALFLLLALPFLGATEVLADPGEPNIKVLLTESSANVTLKSNSAFNLFGAGLGQKIQALELKYKAPNQIEIGQHWIAQSPFYAFSKAGVHFRGKTYDGLFEIHTHGKSLQVINSIPLEQYLVGVVCAESNPNWPLEALKVQSVLARTYALYKANQSPAGRWQITNETSDQVYQGKKNLPAACYEAVEDTYGVALTYQGALIPSFYHSNSGGQTEDPASIWSERMAFLSSSATSYGKSDPNYYWTYKLSLSELEQHLRAYGYNVGYVKQISVLEQTSSGRVKNMVIQADRAFTLSGEKFREWIGYNKIKSTKFTIYKDIDGFAISGVGSGHGVGYCQWCGKEMANQGFDFEAIIQAFYKQVNFTKVY